MSTPPSNSVNNIPNNEDRTNTNLFKTEIRPEYRDARKAPFGNFGKAQAWRNEIIDQLECYEIPTYWRKDHIDQLLTDIVNSMRQDQTNGLEARMIVAAASYMVVPGSVSEGRMIVNEKFGTVPLKWSPKSAKTNPIEKVSVVNPLSPEEIFERTLRVQKQLDDAHDFVNNVNRIISSQKYPQMSKEAQDKYLNALQVGLANIPIYEQMLDAELAAINNEQTVEGFQYSNGTYEGPTYNDKDFKYLLFVCGFLFKVITKTSGNIEKSWDHKTMRFKNFYFFEDEPMTLPMPSTKWLENIKRQFSLDRLALNTALKLVNKLEVKYYETNSTEIGLIRYLYSTPLSYSGMHAYKLFCASREKLKKDADWILSNLSSHHFKDALDTIYLIFNDFEEGSEKNAPFNPAFRYARLVGSQYFPAVQTKACAELTYCLGQVVSHFEDKDSGFNPEEIVGTKNVSFEMKSVMRAIAKNLIRAKVQDDAASNSDVVQRGFDQPFVERVEFDDMDNENPTAGPVIPTDTGFSMKDLI